MGWGHPLSTVHCPHQGLLFNRPSIFRKLWPTVVCPSPRIESWPKLMRWEIDSLKYERRQSLKGAGVVPLGPTHAVISFSVVEKLKQFCTKSEAIYGSVVSCFGILKLWELFISSLLYVKTSSRVNLADNKLVHCIVRYRSDNTQKSL